MMEAEREAAYRLSDEKLAVLAPGAEAPGRFIPSDKLPGLQQWQGAVQWRTRQGGPIVTWALGAPQHVFGARYPDGSRGFAWLTLDHGWARRSSGPTRWLYGTIRLEPDDVVFEDGRQPVYVPPMPSNEPNLEAVLARDPAFPAAIQDDRFARAVYAVFQNRTFVRDEDEGRWLCGIRQAAYLVADLRQLGESYHDFYLDSEFDGVWPDDRSEREALLRSFSATSDVEGAERLRSALANMDSNADVFDDLRAHLTRLGWRTENASDRSKAAQQALDRALVAFDAIKHLEQAPAGSWPSLAERVTKDRSSRLELKMFRRDLLDRMLPDARAVTTGVARHRLEELALSGRISLEKFQDLSSQLPR